MSFHQAPAMPSVGRRRRVRARWLPWLCGFATIGLMISYPLVHGQARTVVTIATVIAFFATSALHALLHRGWWWTIGFVVIAAGGGLLAEAIGVRTGWPFGHYAYDDSLGWTVLRVPVVVPLAWAMFAYPALIVGRRVSRRLGWLFAAVALAAWDVFLDPQMVEAGHWRWEHVTTTLRGIPDVPLSNFLGWLGVAAVMMLLLDRLPRRRVDDTLPATMFLWTFGASVLANAAFFDRPSVALAGGIAMGVVALPYLARVWVARP